MSADAHARVARAERRWTKRGRAPATLLLSWMSRAHPWAWRVRLDLVVLFNLILAGLCFLLAHVAGPGIVVRTRDFDPSFAAGVLFTISALVALGCTVYWSFAVSRSARLREAAHYANQPGLIVASLVFLSFALWTIAGSISPFVDLERHPVFGDNIETSIDQRIRMQRNIQPSPEDLVHRDFWTFRMAPQPRPSEAACRRASESENASAGRDAYLCSLSAGARKADLWRALAFDSSLEEWRANRSDVATTFIFSVGSRASFANPPDLGEAVVRFALETEPWKSRISAMNPWERDADVLEDPMLPAAFARTADFDRLIARQVLFGQLWNVPEALFDGVPERARPGQPARFQRWQAKARSELMATPVFAEALSAAEDAFLGRASAPPIFAPRSWDTVRDTRAHILASFHLTGDVQTEMALGDETPRAAWLAEGEALEGNPAVRAAFLNGVAYAKWKAWYLYALVGEGAFDAQIRSLKPYGHVAAQWRATLLRPPAAPEARLLDDLFSTFASWPLAIPAALILAFVLVSLNRAGLGVTLGALAVHAILALILFNTFLIAGYDQLRSLTVSGGIVLAALMAPTVALASFLVRGVRGRWTAFLAATAIWGVVVWLAFANPMSNLIMIPVGRNLLVWSLVSVASYALIVIAVAQLVLAMNARIARFPRTS